MPLSKAAPLRPHLVNASREISVTEDINKSILASSVTPMFRLYPWQDISLTLHLCFNCHIIMLAVQRFVLKGDKQMERIKIKARIKVFEDIEL